MRSFHGGAVVGRETVEALRLKMEEMWKFIRAKPDELADYLLDKDLLELLFYICSNVPSLAEESAIALHEVYDRVSHDPRVRAESLKEGKCDVLVELLRRADVSYPTKKHLILVAHRLCVTQDNAFKTELLNTALLTPLMDLAQSADIDESIRTIVCESMNLLCFTTKHSGENMPSTQAHSFTSWIKRYDWDQPPDGQSEDRRESEKLKESPMYPSDSFPSKAASLTPSQTVQTASKSQVDEHDTPTFGTFDGSPSSVVVGRHDPPIRSDVGLRNPLPTDYDYRIVPFQETSNALETYYEKNELVKQVEGLIHLTNGQGLYSVDEREKPSPPPPKSRLEESLDVLTAVVDNPLAKHPDLVNVLRKLYTLSLRQSFVKELLQLGGLPVVLRFVQHLSSSDDPTGHQHLAETWSYALDLLATIITRDTQDVMCECNGVDLLLSMLSDLSKAASTNRKVIASVLSALRRTILGHADNIARFGKQNGFFILSRLIDDPHSRLKSLECVLAAISKGREAKDRARVAKILDKTVALVEESGKGGREVPVKECLSIIQKLCRGHDGSKAKAVALVPYLSDWCVASGRKRNKDEFEPLQVLLEIVDSDVAEVVDVVEQNGTADLIADFVGEKSPVAEGDDDIIRCALVPSDLLPDHIAGRAQEVMISRAKMLTEGKAANPTKTANIWSVLGMASKIRNMAKLNPEDLKAAISVLHGHSEGSKIEASATVRKFAGADPEFKTLVRDEGGITALIVSVDSGDDSLKEAALLALSSVVSCHEACGKTFLEGGGCDVVSKILIAEASSKQLKVASAKALWTAAGSCPPVRRKLMAEGKWETMLKTVL